MNTANCVLLSGFMDFDELQSFFAVYCNLDPLSGKRARMDQWAKTYDYMSQRLPASDSYNPPVDLVLDLSDNSKMILDNLRDKIRHYFPYHELGFDIKLVKITELISLQYHVDLEHLAELEKKIRPEMTEAEIIELCVDTVGHPDKSLRKQQQFTDMQGGFAVFTSDREDLRFRSVECRDVYVREEMGKPLTEAKTNALLLIFGGGDPFTAAYRIQSVVSLPGRPPISRQLIVLQDGLHRAYALHRAGYTHMPCVLSDITPSTVSTYLSTWQSRLNYINLVRPPLLRDFFDPNLTMEVAVPPRRTMLRLNWSVETLPIFS